MSIKRQILAKFLESQHSSVAKFFCCKLIRGSVHLITSLRLLKHCTMIHTTMDHNVKINPQLSKKDFFTTMTMLGKRSVQLLLFLIQSTNSCLDVDCQQFQSPMVDFYLPCGLNEGVCLPWSNGLFTSKQVQTELETKDLDFTSRSCLEIGNTSASCGKITTFNLSV